MDKYRDIEQFSKYIKPFLIEKKLPTDIEFIKELSDAFLNASHQLVKFRKDRASKEKDNKCL